MLECYSAWSHLEYFLLHISSHAHIKTKIVWIEKGVALAFMPLFNPDDFCHHFPIRDPAYIDIVLQIDTLIEMVLNSFKKYGIELRVGSFQN
jgi:hypothetical protein